MKFIQTAFFFHRSAFTQSVCVCVSSVVVGCREKKLSATHQLGKIQLINGEFKIFFVGFFSKFICRFICLAFTSIYYMYVGNEQKYLEKKKEPLTVQCA